MVKQLWSNSHLYSIEQQRHNIAEILLMLALNTNQSINQSKNQFSKQ